MRGHPLRILLPGLLVPAILAALVLSLVSWTGDPAGDDARRTPSAAETDAIPDSPWDVRDDQAEVFASESVRATEIAMLTPSPTPEPTATPAPSPQEIAAAELPYVVPPPNVSYGPEERWIAVNVTTQRAYAFIGGTAVHVALVTTGMPDFETPLGDFRIYYRVEKDIMDSETIGIPRDDPLGFYLEDIYYAQYFYPATALHSNYWRPISYFGNVASSHGCVGMLYSDAEFFWDFATYGTRVVIYE
jgi:lipoprotein-anchoring transpeptidase ErfK/SrfK